MSLPFAKLWLGGEGRRNGAGKTTLANILDAPIKPNGGTVYPNGQRTDRLPPYEVARVGLGWTFQVARSFRRMTVLEFTTMEHLRNEYAQTLKIADYVYVRELGRNKFEGEASEFQDLEKAFWVGSCRRWVQAE